MTAQASVTLAEMFPQQFRMASGSGQNMNEHITGDRAGLWGVPETPPASLGPVLSVGTARLVEPPDGPMV